jgi:hypothetical protein
LDRRALQAISRFYQAAYAQVAPNLKIVRASPNFQAWTFDLHQPVNDLPINEALIEFVGYEDSLRSMLRGEIPSLGLERV